MESSGNKLCNGESIDLSTEQQLNEEIDQAIDIQKMKHGKFDLYNVADLKKIYKVVKYNDTIDYNSKKGKYEANYNYFKILDFEIDFIGEIVYFILYDAIIEDDIQGNKAISIYEYHLLGEELYGKINANLIFRIQRSQRSQQRDHKNQID